MKTWKSALLVCALLAAGLARATTWADTEVDDPIDASHKCKVHEPASYGGYIYGWPSKYDQVFWPLTDPNGIWYCEGTGFTAFIGDFHRLGADEKKAVALYLQSHPKRGDDIATRLRLLEDIYALRKTDAAFQNRLLRVLARWYQDEGSIERANGYRKKALADIEKALATTIPEAQRLEYLYVAANYTRLFGDTKASDQYIASLHTAIKQVKDDKVREYSTYLSKLVAETPKIKPGGVLDPPDEKKP